MAEYMKILMIKKLVQIAGLIIIAVSAAACNDIPYESDENQYKTNLDIYGEKTWTRNKNAVKISQAYLPYTGTHDVDAFFYLPDDNTYATVGFGNLINGTLDLTVRPDKLTDKNLMEWEYLKTFFNSESGVGVWDNVTLIKPPNVTVKGNMLLIDAFTKDDISGGMLDRQRFFGDRNSLSCETLLYFYLNENCIITGTRDKGYRNGSTYLRAENDLKLSLKKGWNLITRTEKYNTNISGYATIFMEIKPIKNPQDYKWVIETGFRL